VASHVMATYFLAFGYMVPATAADTPAGPLPVWDEGDWWEIVSVLILERAMVEQSEQRGAAGVSQPKVFCEVRSRFVVRAQQKTETGFCDVIEIHPVGVPQCLRKDMPAGPLTKLWIRRATGTLARIEELQWSIFAGEHRGKWDSSEFPQDAPVGETCCFLCPADVPRLPASLNELIATSVNPLVQDYCSGMSSDRVKQIVHAHHDTVFGSLRGVVIVTLATKSLLHSMTWIPGLPWWAEWRVVDPDGDLYPANLGFIHARLVAFGKKGEKGVIVPPIHSGLGMRPADGTLESKNESKHEPRK